MSLLEKMKGLMPTISKWEGPYAYISRHRFLLLLNGKCKIPPSPSPYVLGL